MGEIGRNAFEGRKVQLKKALLNHAVATVLALKQEHSSLISMPQPKVWFSLPSFVSDSPGPSIGDMLGTPVWEIGIPMRADAPTKFALCAKIGQTVEAGQSPCYNDVPDANYDRDLLVVCCFTKHSLASYSRQLKDY